VVSSLSCDQHLHFSSLPLMLHTPPISSPIIQQAVPSVHNCCFPSLLTLCGSRRVKFPAELWRWQHGFIVGDGRCTLTMGGGSHYTNPRSLSDRPAWLLSLFQKSSRKIANIHRGWLWGHFSFNATHVVHLCAVIKHVLGPFRITVWW
jgi:hypothetical protein